MNKDNHNNNIPDKSYIDGVDFIETPDLINDKVNYYYYIPKNSINNRIKPDLLICVPGLSGNGRYFVNDIFKQFAQNNQFIIVAPSFIFNNTDFKNKKSYQYPEKWSGKALLNIIDKLNNSGYRTKDNYFYGFSAGAQFITRFALLKPDKCKAVIAHARGGELIKLNRFIKTKFMISVGKKDISRIENNEVFYYSCEWHNIHAIFKLYDCDHIIPDQQITDTIEFITKVKEDNLSIFEK
ncbi:MAG: alpha/beta fold hydrolase [Vampirovibrionia bacterium]